MLTHMHIRQFVVIEALDLNFNTGLTVVTGETGAGKSVLMSALSLVTGGRADIGVIRDGADSADIVAIFEISNLAEVVLWLDERQLTEESQCLLRRVLTKDGRSKAFINGVPVSIGQLKQVGDMLVNLHRQQAHQHLLGRRRQLTLLDAFGCHQGLCEEVARLHTDIANAKKELEALAEPDQNEADRITLLEYQLTELVSMNLQDLDLPALEAEHLALAGAESNRAVAMQALQELSEQEESATTLIHRNTRQLAEIQGNTDSLIAAQELLTTSAVSLEDAVRELRIYCDGITESPERLRDIEEQLTQIHDLARKHRVQPQELNTLMAQLEQQKHQIEQARTNAEQLQIQLIKLQDDYQERALALRSARKVVAGELALAVSAYFSDLGMKGGCFSVDMQATDETHAFGMDQVTFLFSGGTGHHPRPLDKVASGGELSRLSLALQLVIVEKSPLPTLIFDEADAGIGGHTAEKIGHLLRSLAKHTQVICVTHLPQVAAHGEHHLHVQKIPNTNTASLEPLAADDRKIEIARMLDGNNLTKSNLALAGEMLQRAG